MYFDEIIYVCRLNGKQNNSSVACFLFHESYIVGFDFFFIILQCYIHRQTLRSRAFLQTLTIAQPANEPSAFYGIRRFITVFTRVYQWALW